MNNKQIIINSFAIPFLFTAISAVLSFFVIFSVASIWGYDSAKLWPTHTRFAFFMYLLALFAVQRGYPTFIRLCEQNNWQFTRRRFFLSITALSALFLTFFYCNFRYVESPSTSFIYAVLWYVMLCLSLFVHVKRAKEIKRSATRQKIK